MKADAMVATMNDGIARLARIAHIIEQVDQRCMAADGPVTPTLKEMTQAEISEIYALAKHTEQSKDYTK